MSDGTGDFVKILAAVAIIAIIIIAGVVGYLLLSQSDENVQSSPGKVFEEWVKRVNNYDGEGAVSLMMNSLVQNESFEEEMRDMKEDVDTGEVVVKNYRIEEVLCEGDMDASNLSTVDIIKDTFNNDWNIDIENICFLTANFTLISDGIDDPRITTFPFGRVNGKWYMILF